MTELDWELPDILDEEENVAETLEREEDEYDRRTSILGNKENVQHMAMQPMLSAIGLAYGAALSAPVAGTAILGSVGSAFALKGSRDHFSGIEEPRDSLNRVRSLKDNTVFYDGKTDYSEELPGDQDITEVLADLIHNSEEVEFEDFYFPKETSLHDFRTEPALSFYESLLNEPSESPLRHGRENEHIDYFLTVEDTENGEGRYVLDVGVKHDLAGRFTGYTDQDLEPLLKAGEDDYNTNIRF